MNGAFKLALWPGRPDGAPTGRRQGLTPGPRRPLNIVHTSDVHLESDSFGNGPAGDTLRERVRRSFSGVIEIANERHAYLLLIVGDLFSSTRLSEGALGFALGEIAPAAMPV